MKKVFTIVALCFTLLSIKANAYELMNFEGKFACTSAEGVTPNDAYSLFMENYYVDLENYVGTVLETQYNQWGAPNELSVQKLIPMQGYYGNTFYAVADVDNLNAKFIGTRDGSYGSACYIGGKYFYAYKYVDGEFSDLYMQWSDDLKSITIENLAIVEKASFSDDPSAANIMYTADKVVYEAYYTPKQADVVSKVNTETGKIDITYTAPTKFNEGDTDIPNEPCLKLQLRQSNQETWEYDLVEEKLDVYPGQEFTYSFTPDKYDPFSGVQFRIDTYYGTAMTEVYNYAYKGVRVADISKITAKAQEGGKAPVNVAFTLPSAEALDGIKLTYASLVRTEYSTWDAVEVKRFTEGLDPEATLTYDDNDVKEGQKYQYEVKVGFEYGYSGGMYAEVFVGLDGPGHVNNITGTANVNEVTLKWDAPTEGRNKGYFDPEAVRYAIMRQDANDYSWDEEKQMPKSGVWVTPEGGVAETTLVDNLDLDMLKEFSYHIYTFCEGYENFWAGQCNVVAGPLASLPFLETWDKKGSTSDYVREPEYMWTRAESWTPSIGIDYYAYLTDNYYTIWGHNDEDPSSYDPNDHPDGFLYITPYSYMTSSDYTWYQSAGLDFTGALNPVASFYICEYSFECNEHVDIQFINNDADEPAYVTCGSFNPGNKEDLLEPTWVKKYVKLEGAANSSNVNIRFYFPMSDNVINMSTVAVDELYIDDFPPVTDLEATITEDPADPTHELVTLTWSDPSTPTQEAISYDVYKDGVLVSAEQVEWEYNDATDENDHEYYVVAHFEADGGVDITTPASNVVKVERSGVKSAAVDSNVKVSVVGHTIVVEGAERVSIASADGRQVCRANGRTAYNAANGVYVVTANGASYKVIVK